MTGVMMPVKPDQIEVMPLLQGMQGKPPLYPAKRDQMGGKKSEPPKKGSDKPKKPVQAPVDDDDYEDGDIATPKRDRSGNDDEPL